MKEQSAWFVAESPGCPDLSVPAIEAWLGDFSPIANQAKLSARRGQGFSTHFCSVPVPAHRVREIPDIERGGQCFTDGIGLISEALAQRICHDSLWEYLEEGGAGPLLPSAFQIRYAGAKGVVAVREGGGGGADLWLRPSMIKFQSERAELEILNWGRFMPGFLNRQVILLLSTLGVPDEVFLHLQSTMVRRLDESLLQREGALHMLEETGGDSKYGHALALLHAGIEPRGEPFLRIMLEAVREFRLMELVTKARMFVPQSRWLLGVADAAGVLEYGECFIQISSPSSLAAWGRRAAPWAQYHQAEPEQGQGQDTEGGAEAGAQWRVVTGPVLMAKNPCLHPGDVRRLLAVDRPELRGHRNCLVLPTKGPISHATEASGSDFDGDVFLALWDPALMQGLQPHEAMDYSPPNAAVQTEPPDVCKFFVDQMLNDDLGVICNAHLVHADLSIQGARDPVCLYLAQQASLAVDFPKTGVPGVMPQEYRPTKYPDFMEKRHKWWYRSEKVLGKLYRSALESAGEAGAASARPQEGRGRRISFEVVGPTLDEVAAAYRPELVQAHAMAEHLDAARENKREYDQALLDILLTNYINCEGKLLSGSFVHLGKGNGYTDKERVMLEYRALRREFRYRLLHGEPSTARPDGEHIAYEDLDVTTLGPETSAAARARGAAWYHVTYDREELQAQEQHRSLDDLQQLDSVPILLSFGWIGLDLFYSSQGEF